LCALLAKGSAPSESGKRHLDGAFLIN
jgi:hypothetical protein